MDEPCSAQHLLHGPDRLNEPHTCSGMDDADCSGRWYRDRDGARAGDDMAQLPLTDETAAAAPRSAHIERSISQLAFSSRSTLKGQQRSTALAGQSRQQQQRCCSVDEHEEWTTPGVIEMASLYARNTSAFRGLRDSETLRRTIVRPGDVIMTDTISQQ